MRWYCGKVKINRTSIDHAAAKAAAGALEKNDFDQLSK
jgi:hypothetical protein